MPCSEEDFGDDVDNKSPNDRESFVAQKLAKIIEVMADLNNEERNRIMKTAQAFYGAWGKNNRETHVKGSL